MVRYLSKGRGWLLEALPLSLLKATFPEGPFHLSIFNYVKWIPWEKEKRGVCWGLKVRKPEGEMEMERSYRNGGGYFSSQQPCHSWCCQQLMSISSTSFC